MHYTDKNNWDKNELKICKNTLTAYHNNYTQVWIDFYSTPQSKRKKSDKPTDSYWTDEKIRQPLIGIFERNCGYCGRLTIWATKVDETGKYPKGHIEHYEPKSKVPEKVYNWDNYLWACEDCNRKKKEFYDPVAHLFNPCRTTDMQLLEFDPQDGDYKLSTLYQTDKKLQKRYANTRKWTMFVEDDICEERQLLFEEITELLTKINRNSKSAFYRTFAKRKLDTFIRLLKRKIKRYKQYRKLQRQIIVDFCKKNHNFAYRYSDFGL